jgi:predicted RNA binding protein YcfA (HicA-like mRNA interferase family)
LAKKRKKGQLRRGPFTSNDVKKALALDGWQAEPGGGHQTVYRHPAKRGKIPVSEGWTALRAWCPILRGMCRTAGLSKDELLHLLNGVRP